jgi:hypothetical protein
VDTLDGLRYVLKCNVEGVVAPPEEIEKAIANYYGRATGAWKACCRRSPKAPGAARRGEEAAGGRRKRTESDAPIINW